MIVFVFSENFWILVVQVLMAFFGFVHGILILVLKRNLKIDVEKRIKELKDLKSDLDQISFEEKGEKK